MPFERITISAAGLELSPITFSMQVSAKEASRSFEAKVKEPTIGQAALLDALAGKPECTIQTAQSFGAVVHGSGVGELILTGNVEKRSPQISASEKELTISGRSKTGDFVDSTHEHPTGELRKKKPDAMISEVAEPFGITVESDAELDERELSRLRPGETAFAFSERIARAAGVTITDTPEGNLRIQGEPKKQHAGAIIYGASWPAIKDASAVFDDSKRFSEYKVKAQAPDGYAPDVLEIEESAKDSGIRRKRLRVITPPEQLTKAEARKRAKYHRDRAAGRGVSAQVTLVGWRDQAGKLWQPGWLVPVEIADLGLSQLMMIESATFSQSGAETECSLSLVDPRAYGGKSGKGSKSGKGWALEGIGAEDSA